MSESQLLLVIGASAAMVALCMLVIACCAVSSTRSIRRMERRTNALINRWQPVAHEASHAIKEFAEQSGELLTRLNRLSALLHKQAEHAGGVLDDLVAAAQRNVFELDLTVQETLARFRRIAEALERAVRFPATRIRAVAEGVSAAFRHLTRRQPRSPERVSTDEEMFI